MVLIELHELDVYQLKFLLCASSACPLDRRLPYGHEIAANFSSNTGQRSTTFIHDTDSPTQVIYVAVVKKRPHSAPRVRGYSVREAHLRPSMTWQRTWQLCFEVLQTKYPLELFMPKQISVFRLPCLPFSVMKVHIFLLHSVARTIFTTDFYGLATAFTVHIQLMSARDPFGRSNDVELIQCPI